MEKLVLLPFILLFFVVKYFYNEYKINKEVKEQEKLMTKIIHPEHGSASVNTEYLKENMNNFLSYGWKVQ